VAFDFSHSHVRALEAVAGQHVEEIGVPSGDAAGRVVRGRRRVVATQARAARGVRLLKARGPVGGSELHAP